MRRRTRELLVYMRRLRRDAETEVLPPIPAPAEFKSKNGLPVLDDYSQEVFPEEYWSNWYKKSFREMGEVRSWVDSARLRDLAMRAGYTDLAKLDLVCRRLEEGAKLGVTGRGRLPTECGNSKKIVEYGERIGDAIQSWILEDPPTAFGPLRREELPWGEFSISPLGCKVRWDGKVRPIVDASSPRDNDTTVPGWLWDPQLPGAVNSTIVVEDYPAQMSDTAKFVRALWRAGLGALVTKKDLVSAYKHQRVHPDDLSLQVVKWGGRYFVELALMFGTRSSPGIFSDLFRLFVDCVTLLAGMEPYMVEQHLDDVLGIGDGGEEGTVHKFHEMFMEEADKAGFRPDKSCNREKNQAPDTEVIALGVSFNTVDWSWGYSEGKLATILQCLSRVEGGERLVKTEMESLAGKLNAIRFLVHGGKYNVSQFYRCRDGVVRGTDLVASTGLLRQQAKWWRVSIQVARVYSPIVHPDGGMPANAKQAWSDAAGGSFGHIGPGLGVVYPATLSWAYLPWPTWLNQGRANSDGVIFTSKLTALELLGPLVAVCVAGEDGMSSTLRVHVDNSGSVGIFNSGHGTCKYASTLAKAAFDVSTGMGITLKVCKIRRCSDKGSVLADAISKGDIKGARKLWPGMGRLVEVPKAVIDWVKDPKEDFGLGQRILEELRGEMRDIVC